MNDSNTTTAPPVNGVVDVPPEVRGDLSKTVYERAGIVDLPAFYASHFAAHSLGDFVTHYPLASHDIRFIKEYHVYKNVRAHGPGRVLDLGCSAGRLGVLKAIPGVELYGIDITDNAFEQTRAIGYDHLVAHDILSLPFPDNMFDYVVSLDVLGHIEAPDKGRLMREIRRVLKPGGYTIHGIEEMAIDYSQMTDALIEYIRIDGHVGLQTIDQIRELFGAYFDDVEAEFAFGPCPNYWDILKYREYDFADLPAEIYDALAGFNDRDIEVFSLTMGIVREKLAKKGLLSGGGYVLLNARNAPKVVTIPPADGAKDYREHVQTLSDLRNVVAIQQGTGSPPVPDAIVQADVPHFSPYLPPHLEPGARQALLTQAEALHPWVQGPFYLGGDVVIGGAWRNDLRWKLLAAELPPSLAGQRVLDIGCNAGYDCFSFNLLGPALTLGIDPGIFIEQAYFLNTIYRTPVRFEKVGWQDLDPGTHGLFDIVHCHGVLYHEQDPMLLLNQLLPVVKPGGSLYLGCFILTDDRFTDHARFIPGTFWNDPTWWWVYGANCLRTMVESAGFEMERAFGHWPVPNGDFPITNVYYKARRRE